MDCLFCKIANNKEAQSDNAIYEDDAAVAVLDLNPLASGHTMVLPKVHAENILDLPEDQVGPVFRVVRRVVALLQKTLAPDGFTIGINHGRASHGEGAGPGIDHLHIHIIPRYKGDGGISIHGVVSNPPKESLQEIRSKILNI